MVGQMRKTSEAGGPTPYRIASYQKIAIDDHLMMRRTRPKP
jgi:hypothetical protein